MHIVLLSDEEEKGAAAIAATRLAQGLADAGHTVTRLVPSPGAVADGGQAWTTRALSESALRSRLFGLAGRVMGEGREAHMRERATRSMLSAMLEELRPDVVSVHNLHRAGWSPELVAVCVEHAPTAWTLHDMWSFTGRCLYSWDCRKFVEGCDDLCPTPTEYPALEPHRIRGAWEERRELFEAHPGLVAVTPSAWLAREAQAGLWSGHEVRHIRYGLPLDVYRPRARDDARDALHIPRNRQVLLVATANLEERRMGGRLLLEALARLDRDGVLLVTIGEGELPREVGGVKVWPLGHLGDERTRAAAYSAADILVHPAPVDNSPVVVLESMACGTPAVGFTVGGMPELVTEGETGWLAGEPDAGALRDALGRALDDVAGGSTLREPCRRFAEAELGLERQAERYIELFESLVGGTGETAAAPM